ncbi:hypothetical protein [Polymorphobacter sp. PAMC 29334]|uniref:hypothetical protein n=1 Tax=Polymorphobacter sp. PAMC 29334 TaxID=2862331 RepID=UPI002104845C|nr:hypothetical protein [Polymorphobacter sp. PAMC 29334]
MSIVASAVSAACAARKPASASSMLARRADSDLVEARDLGGPVAPLPRRRSLRADESARFVEA